MPELISLLPLRIAKNPNTPSVVLDVLAKNRDFRVRGHVAANPNTSIKLLRKLSQDTSLYVRIHVAENPNTTDVILKILSKDRDWLIRGAAARHPNINLETLEKLANERYVGIWYNVLRNPKTPQRIKNYLMVDIYLRNLWGATS